MGKGGENGKLGNSTLVVGGIDAPGSSCISIFSTNLTFDKTLMMQFCYFFLQKSSPLFGPCVSIQNSS